MNQNKLSIDEYYNSQIEKLGKDKEKYMSLVNDFYRICASINESDYCLLIMPKKGIEMGALNHYFKVGFNSYRASSTIDFKFKPFFEKWDLSEDTRMFVDLFKTIVEFSELRDRVQD